MSVTSVIRSGRDRALLKAIAAGRCQFRGGCEVLLLVDGLVFADFSVARRLIDDALVVAPDPAVPLAPAVLTPAGIMALSG